MRKTTNPAGQTIHTRNLIITLTCVIFTSALSSVSAACYKSINDIISDEFAVTNDSSTREYELCKANEFGGKKPLLIFRPNVIIKCGSNGQSSRECNFNQGYNGQQVIVGSPQDIYTSFISTAYSEGNSFRKEFEVAMDGMTSTQKTQSISNVELKGITFTKHSKDSKAKKQTEPNVQIISPSSVMMDDCVLKDNVNRPFLIRAMGKPTDTSTEGTILLDVYDSTFQNNSPGDNVVFPGDYGTYNTTRLYAGLIVGSDVGSIVTNVRVVSTTFSGNSYIKSGSSDNLAEEGSFLVGTGLGALTIKNSCFTNNAANLGLVANHLGDVTGGLNMAFGNTGDCSGFSRVDPDDPSSGITVATLESLCKAMNSTRSCQALGDDDETTFEELLDGDDDFVYISFVSTVEDEVSMFLKVAGPVVVFAVGFLIGILLGTVFRCLCSNSACCNRDANAASAGY